MGCLCFGRDLPREFYHVSFRKRVYTTLEELRADVDEWVRQYNEERLYSGKYCCGKTLMQMFLDSINVVKEKMIGYNLTYEVSGNTMVSDRV